MKNRILPYVVEKLPESRKDPASRGKTIYYCHMRGFPGIPVFGSIGPRAKAQRVCDDMNGVPKCERRKKAR